MSVLIMLGWTDKLKERLMYSFTDIAGLAGVASAVTAASLVLPGIARLSKRSLGLLQVAVFVVMLIPFSDISPAAYLRGASGDLSITTLMLIGCTLFRLCFDEENNIVMQRQPLLVLIALTALLLYPLSLGLTNFDPYRLGYGDTLFLATLLVAALAAWVWKYHLIASCISLATLAWSIGWYESSNIWDYLIDPWVAVYALTVIMLRLIKLVWQYVKSFQPNL